MNEPAESSSDVGSTASAGPVPAAAPQDSARPWWFWVIACAIGIVALVWVRMAVDSHAACQQQPLLTTSH